MAGFTHPGPDAGARPTDRIARLTTWTGALVSLALVTGVAVWGTRLILRDVSGVPVVQASEGPMRVAPDDPGGEAADHQGLSVNDVAGTGIAADPADRLVLAPRPIELSEEDGALGLTALAAQVVARDTAVRNGPPVLSAEPVALNTRIAAPDPARTADNGLPVPDAPAGDPEAATTDTADGAGADTVQALADQIAANVAPLWDADGNPVAADAVAQDDAAAPQNAIDDAIAMALSEAIPTEVAGVARSLRPQLRPSGLQQSAALVPQAAVAPVAPATTELDPAALPTGTRLVQLGAFDSPETARAEWARLESRFGDYMQGKDRVIQRASSGGRVFYRLRAHGFSDIADARRFCSAFVSENADCIPVVTR